MMDPAQQIAQLLEEDARYRFDAYAFVFEALSYAQNVLGLGSETVSEQMAADDEPDDEPDQEPDDDDVGGIQRHVSGQELCEAIREYALKQYGYLAKTVLNSWGIRKTNDFGEIVFNLISIGQMRKTPHDCRADFDDVYDFDAAFHQEFKISPE